MSWTEDQEYLTALDALMEAAQPEADQLMEILHERGFLNNPQLISVYALGVFANEYHRLRGRHNPDTGEPFNIVELVVMGDLAIRQDERLQSIAASMMAGKVDEVVMKNG